MSVTYQKPVLVPGSFVWRLLYSSNLTPPVLFRSYLGGVEIQPEYSSPDGLGQVEFLVPPGDSPHIEVLDISGQRPHFGAPGRLTINWISRAGIPRYRVYESVSSNWVLQQEIANDGQRSIEWLSRWLENVTAHDFKVVPVDSGGNEGTAKQLTCFMIRHPDPPNWSGVVNANGSLTISIT